MCRMHLLTFRKCAYLKFNFIWRTYPFTCVKSGLYWIWTILICEWRMRLRLGLAVRFWAWWLRSGTG